MHTTCYTDVHGVFSPRWRLDRQGWRDTHAPQSDGVLRHEGRARTGRDRLAPELEGKRALATVVERQR